MVAWNQGIQDKTIQCCGFAKTTQEDKAKMSFSCQHGCTSGTPFMFNWTHPAMPGTFKIEKLRSQCFDTTFTIIVVIIVKIIFACSFFF